MVQGMGGHTIVKLMPEQEANWRKKGRRVDPAPEPYFCALRYSTIVLRVFALATVFAAMSLFAIFMRGGKPVRHPRRGGGAPERPAMDAEIV